MLLGDVLTGKLPGAKREKRFLFEELQPDLTTHTHYVHMHDMKQSEFPVGPPSSDQLQHAFGSFHASGMHFSNIGN